MHLKINNFTHTKKKKKTNPHTSMLNIKLTVLLSTELFISKCYCLAQRGKSNPKKTKTKKNSFDDVASIRPFPSEINHVTVLYSNKSWEPLIKGTPVHIGIGQEFSQFIALSVVVHHTKAFVTEETWVTRSKLVVGGIPSRKTRYVISL